MKRKNARVRLRKRLGGVLGEHKLALDYAIVSYALQGYNAATIRRLLNQDYPDWIKETINEPAILYTLQRAIDSRIVTVHTPRLDKLEKQLSNFYHEKFQVSINFFVADDSIGFRYASSMTPFFWGVAAEAVASTLSNVLLSSSDDGSDANIVVGITGGPSSSEAIKHLMGSGMDPAFIDNYRKRLWFLSLTSAGSARQFDCHSNYLAALMGQLYRANHYAVVGDEESETIREDYQQKLSSMQMLIGGVGAHSGYLMNWFKQHRVQPPQGMIGDVFLLPIDKNGKILALSEAASRSLAPLRLNLTRDQIHDFTIRPQHRSLVIVSEPKDQKGRITSEKQEVLDVALKCRFITDCVMTGSMAKNLLLKYKQNPEA